MADHFNKGAGENTLEFPFTRQFMRDLEPCDLVSPRVGNFHGYAMPLEICNPTAREASAKEIDAVRENVKAGIFPREFMEKYAPDEWGVFPSIIPELLAGENLSFDDPKGLANVVHMDEPDDLGRAMRKWLMSKGCVHHAADIRFNDFIANIPRTNAELSQVVYMGLDKAFDIKWAGGSARYEERTGKGPSATEYPEGCPSHPSWPAGHGRAAFDCALYFMRSWRLVENGKLVKLPDELKAPLFWSAYIWAMARSLAGVHDAVDNLLFAPRKSEV